MAAGVMAGCQAPTTAGPLGFTAQVTSGLRRPRRRSDGRGRFAERPEQPDVAHCVGELRPPPGLEVRQQVQSPLVIGAMAPPAQRDHAQPIGTPAQRTRGQTRRIGRRSAPQTMQTRPETAARCASDATSDGPDTSGLVRRRGLPGARAGAPAKRASLHRCSKFGWVVPGRGRVARMAPPH